jgi:hypothetical protein
MSSKSARNECWSISKSRTARISAGVVTKVILVVWKCSGGFLWIKVNHTGVVYSPVSSEILYI